ncbi:XrtA/PEP-CTERM system exopolysaccharide export protein [Erythrobacter sp. F6033]|uniref:XrtA/PEP-CTERM system exopolysaccharide export protein n=1 Tax=Erythrobacter sp. F6033 TaxID=2926401 RepID=UPI001FF11F7B|nr:XrtA/PEP-CTERM system exopolysaccharide export protein [Erythrobacter sp. F6033]MCK0128246.1 polysaccharide export protein [Erythrobacter sp. F6033]
MLNSLSLTRLATIAVAPIALAACAGGPSTQLPAATFSTGGVEAPTEDYILGPLDQITVHVWRNPELSAEDIQVRPDGRITIPLVQDMVAVGKTPTQLQDDIKESLSEYIEQPIVSVIVNEFNGALPQQIRITGAGAEPAALAYRANMTVLDAMIAVGGLGEFAAGNRATLTRYETELGENKTYRLRLKDLLNKGDATANVALKPGDTISIPESRF